MGGMTGLLLLLWAGVTVGSVVDLQKRIIGGENCPGGHREYHVILKSRNGDLVCGGSLISDQWVLTAAHCWKDDPAWTMTAILGGDQVTIGEITEHKIYAEDGVKHDIMLLKLPKKITDIKPAELPIDCKVPLNIGDEVEIAGHASTIMGPSNERVSGVSMTLQCGYTTHVNCDEVRKWVKANIVPEIKGRFNQHWFCGQRAGVDVSPGDYGGGVLFHNRLYGVISFTGNPTHAFRAALGFMNVCHDEYLNWIYTTTGIIRPVQG